MSEMIQLTAYLSVIDEEGIHFNVPCWVLARSVRGVSPWLDVVGEGESAKRVLSGGTCVETCMEGIYSNYHVQEKPEAVVAALEAASHTGEWTRPTDDAVARAARYEHPGTPLADYPAREA